MKKKPSAKESSSCKIGNVNAKLDGNLQKYDNLLHTL